MEALFSLFLLVFFVFFYKFFFLVFFCVFFFGCCFCCLVFLFEVCFVSLGLKVFSQFCLMFFLLSEFRCFGCLFL